MLTLRPYQTAALAAIRAAAAQGHKRTVLVMPTGSGKTLVLAALCAAAVARGRRVLAVVHRTELVDQTADALAAYGVGVGAISPAAASPALPNAPVQVAMIQTLVRRNLRPPADLLLYDECHHSLADEWAPLVTAYPFTVGATATPERSDGRGLGALFTHLVVGARVRELIAVGALVPPVTHTPGRKLRPEEIAQRPVDAYLAHAQGRRALVFSPRVAIGQAHTDEFRAAGIDAWLVTGTTPAAERRQAFADLRTGRLRVLVNVQVATEGFDIPEIDCVILARHYSTAGNFIQCAGRALRPAPGKPDALYLDLVGTSHVHGGIDDDRVYSLAGRGISRAADGDVIVQSYCRVCGAPMAAPPCPECGYAAEVKPQRVTGDKLVPYAHLRLDDDATRVQRLARWIAKARDHRPAPYREGWSRRRYQVIYLAWPPDSIWREAVGLAAGLPVREWQTDGARSTA